MWTWSQQERRPSQRPLRSRSHSLRQGGGMKPQTPFTGSPSDSHSHTFLQRSETGVWSPCRHSVPLFRSALWPGHVLQTLDPQPELWSLQAFLLTLNPARAVLSGLQTPSSFPPSRRARASHCTQPPVSERPSLLLYPQQGHKDVT